MIPKPIQITAGLIRKARIAEDLGWTCPYTGKTYDAIDLVSCQVDKDPIIPRSLRPSDSLDSLVVTFAEVNKMKGQRTAGKFVSDEQGKVVEGSPQLSIVSFTRFKQWAKSLETHKDHDDDKRRKEKRKELLMLPNYEEKGFVPRDLTVTSQLVRLGAQVIKKTFAGSEKPPMIVSLPGSVTATVRKGWNLLGRKIRGLAYGGRFLLNAMPRGAGMAALKAIVAPFAGKAIVRAERDDTTAENVDARGFGSRGLSPHRLQHGPADGAVADIKCKFQIGRDRFQFVLGAFESFLLKRFRNQDKVG